MNGMVLAAYPATCLLLISPETATADRTGACRVAFDLPATHLSADCHSRPDGAAICLGSTLRRRTAHSRLSPSFGTADHLV
jgi:hypothetical protein